MNCPKCGMLVGACRHTTEGQVTTERPLSRAMAALLGKPVAWPRSAGDLSDQYAAPAGTIGQDETQIPTRPQVADAALRQDPPASTAPAGGADTEALAIVSLLRSPRPFDAVLEFARILQQDVSIELAAKDALLSLPTCPQSAGAVPQHVPPAPVPAGGAVSNRNNQLYDPKCRELAEYMTSDRELTDEQLDELSQDIQDLIEASLHLLESEGQS